MNAGTGIPGVHVRGMHLRLPGYGENGPTLEIFTYDPMMEKGDLCINQPGFGHIAFSVDDVQKAHETVLQAGGQALGEIVTVQIATGDKVTWCYVTDPEGNFIELQSWSKK